MKTRVRIIVIGPEEAGQKLLACLRRRLDKAVPDAALYRLIRTGQVRVDGRRAGPHDRLAEGAKLRLPPVEAPDAPDPAGGLDAPPPSDARTAPSELTEVAGIPVLFADADLLVLAKPPGLPTQPGTGHHDAVSTRLARAFPDAPFRPTPAHRLDRDTSGLLLAARSYRMLQGLHEAFRRGLARKDYLAWTRGRFELCPPGQTLLLEDLLEKRGHPGRQKVHAGSGKPALAEVTPLAVGQAASLLWVRLLTGRTHQIRAQLATRGHPVVGDPKYGHEAPPLLLHAWRLRLPERTFALLPDWTGPWAVDPALLPGPPPSPGS